MQKILIKGKKMYTNNNKNIGMMNEYQVLLE